MFIDLESGKELLDGQVQHEEVLQVEFEMVEGVKRLLLIDSSGFHLERLSFNPLLA